MIEIEELEGGAIESEEERSTADQPGGTMLQR